MERFNQFSTLKNDFVNLNFEMFDEVVHNFGEPEKAEQCSNKKILKGLKSTLQSAYFRNLCCTKRRKREAWKTFPLFSKKVSFNMHFSHFYNNC